MAEIENPCFHCYQGAIGECIRCKYGGEYWSGDLGAETIEVDDNDSEQENQKWMILFIEMCLLMN